MGTCLLESCFSLVTSGPWHPAVELREDPLGGGIFSALFAGGHDGIVGHDLCFRLIWRTRTGKSKENTVTMEMIGLDIMEIHTFDVQFTLLV